MLSKAVRIASLYLVVLVFIGCTHTVQEEKVSLINNNFNSTLWMQNAAEYKANSIQVFNVATTRLKILQFSKEITAAIEQQGEYSLLPPAIIVDVDETVLDNSAYQAKLILESGNYESKTWDEWVALKNAAAIPGAVEFINHAKAMGIEVLYITNRECKTRERSKQKCPQKGDTLDNLRTIGIQKIHPDNILLKYEQDNWSSEKKSRREYVSSKYRIIMLVGDDLGDFIPDVKKDVTYVQREKFVLENKSKWGMIWFTLSNPSYGSWLRVMDEPKSQYFRSY
jgi:acid phosphatase